MNINENFNQPIKNYFNEILSSTDKYLLSDYPILSENIEII